jgi:glucokinase
VPYALGIDLGGTKILAGVVEVNTGEVLSSALQRTQSAHGPELVVERMIEVSRNAIELAGIGRNKIRAAGIGVAGQVDAARGVLVRAPNLPEELRGAPLASQVGHALGCPVSLANDVVAAAAGEASFGAGRGLQDFVCIFAGTGIGGAIYADGRPWWGASHTAGELGHMVVQYGGRLCGCGGRGHLEAYASRSAVVRTILAELRLGRPSVLHEVEPNPNPDDVPHATIQDVDVARAIGQGDELAIDMVQQGASYMAAGLASIINLYNPPRIVLGGGMVEKVGLFFDRAAYLGRERALSVPRGSVDIVRAQLHDNSGIIGAAMLAVQTAT